MSYLMAAWALVQPLLPKLLPMLLAWFLPSPAQKAAQAVPEVVDAEKKADAGDPSGLDHL